MTPQQPAPAPEPLPVPVPDNHAHLDMGRGEPAPPVPQVLAAAAAVGVDRVVQIGCDVPAAQYTVQLVEAHPELLGGVALHPNEAPRLAAEGALDEGLVEIERLARHPRVRVVGETGLDYYRTGPEGRQAQLDSFRAHIELAKRLDLTLQIHDRQAHQDVLSVLAEAGAPERTVLHCFSGDVGMARECLARGYYLSFAGPLTYRNADGLRAALAVAPVEQVLVETDAPFLTPHPHRGRPNTPAQLPFTLRVMADVLQVPLETLCETVAATSERLYGPW